VHAIFRNTVSRLNQCSSTSVHGAPQGAPMYAQGAPLRMGSQPNAHHKLVTLNR